MKEGSSVGRSACHRGASSRRPVFMLHAGLDLSRKKIDVCLLSPAGEIVDEWASPPDADRLRGLAAPRRGGRGAGGGGGGGGVGAAAGRRRPGRAGGPRRRRAGARGGRVDERCAVRARS